MVWHIALWNTLVQLSLQTYAGIYPISKPCVNEKEHFVALTFWYNMQQLISCLVSILDQQAIPGIQRPHIRYFSVKFRLKCLWGQFPGAHIFVGLVWAAELEDVDLGMSWEGIRGVYRKVGGRLWHPCAPHEMFAIFQNSTRQQILLNDADYMLSLVSAVGI